MNEIKIIGYSGHSYVCIDSHLNNNGNVSGYYDKIEKKENTYKLKYFGNPDKIINN